MNLQFLHLLLAKKIFTGFHILKYMKGKSMINSVSSVSFSGKNFFGSVGTSNSLKRKTENYYKELFGELERGFALRAGHVDFFNPRTKKITTIYPISDSRIASVRCIGGEEELRLTKINSTGGTIREKGVLTKSAYSTNNQNNVCELWIPNRGFVNVKNL